MDNLVLQSTLLGTQPVIYNVCNFTKPATGQPALISLYEVTDPVSRIRPCAAWAVRRQTYPDALGHGRRARLRRVAVAVQRALGPTPAGVRELRAALPDRRADAAALADKIRQAATFNQGYALTEVLAAAELDLAWHSLPPARWSLT